MQICVLSRKGDKDVSILSKRLKSLEVIGTKEDFLNNGFTNFNKGTLYTVRSLRLERDNNYPITLNISISEKTMKFTEIAILDENFLQPAPINKYYNEKIFSILDELIEAKLIKVKE